MSSERQNLMSVAKLYRLAMKTYALWPQYFARNGYAFPAWHYYFEVTRRCNLRCAMCQYRNWLSTTPVSVQKEGELTTAEWLAVIDQVRRLSLITFTGGEPFLRDDFLEILERASLRTRTHVITNGILLTEERAKRCVELASRKPGGLGFNFAGVSLDGPAEVHDRIRAMRGAFEKGVNGIKRLVEFRNEAGKKCPLVHVTAVIQEANVDHLAEMPQVVAEAGADVLNLTLEVRNWELEGLGDVDPASYKLSAMAFPKIEPQRLSRALKETRVAAAKQGVELRTPDMPDEVMARYYQGAMALRDFRCDGIWTNIIVGARGEVYPCWLMRAGNVREKTLKELWNSPDLRAFRQQTRKSLHAPCVGCCFLVYRGKGVSQ